MRHVVRALDVVVKRNTNDSIGRILIESDSEKNTVIFTCNNGSEVVSYTASKVSVKESGSASIAFGKIVRFISSFIPWEDTYGLKEFRFLKTDKDLKIIVENIHENGKKSKGSLKLDLFDVNSIRKPKPLDKANFILNSAIIKTAINKIVYAIDPAGAAQYLQGMCIRFDKDSIYFTGTNGKMLSEYIVKNNGDLTEGSYILKYNFIMGLNRVLNDDADISFEITKNRVNVMFDNIFYSGEIIVGRTFPDYEASLDAFSNMIVLSKDVLMGHLYPFLDVLDSDDYNRITFSIKNGKVTIYNDFANFEYDESVDYGDDFIVDVNGQFFIQTIEAIKDDKIKIKFSNSDGNLIFDSNTFEDQKALVTHIRRR
jgi:DNA polymerase III sliding clamp (beta) subunit (PCNA family)